MVVMRRPGSGGGPVVGVMGELVVQVQRSTPGVGFAGARWGRRRSVFFSLKTERVDRRLVGGVIGIVLDIWLGKG